MMISITVGTVVLSLIVRIQYDAVPDRVAGNREALGEDFEATCARRYVGLHVLFRALLRCCVPYDAASSFRRVLRRKRLPALASSAGNSWSEQLVDFTGHLVRRRRHHPDDGDIRDLIDAGVMQVLTNRSEADPRRRPITFRLCAVSRTPPR